MDHKMVLKLIFSNKSKRMILAKLSKANQEHKKYKVVLSKPDGTKIKTV